MSLRLAFSLASPGGAQATLSILIFHRVLAQPDALFPHEPDAARFDTLLDWLGRWFTVLPLGEAVARLYSASLPARAAAISFDDGYADNYTHALPLLQRHRLPATFFVASGFLDGGRMWNDTVIEAVRRTRRERLDSGLPAVGTLALGGPAQRRTALARLLPALKHLPPAERDQAVQRLAGQCDCALPQDLMLSSAQLRGLRAAGMEIGAHTLHHPILACCTPAQARHEIVAGRDRLQDILGEPVSLFAYPNGKPGQDYTPAHVEMVRAQGFAAALSTRWGVNSRHGDRYQLARFTPWDRSRWRFGLRLLANIVQRRDMQEAA